MHRPWENMETWRETPEKKRNNAIKSIVIVGLRRQLSWCEHGGGGGSAKM